jgi:cytidylate kinase
MIRTISLEREYGSGAGGIAEKIANHLGWDLWDRELTEEIARRLNCDPQQVQAREEKVDPTFYRLMKTFMRGSYEDSFSGGNRRMELLDAESLSQLFGKVAIDLADRGKCVIVGRAAPYFLRDRSDVLRVFLYAPREEKIRRVMLQGRSKIDAECLIDRVDAERAAFVKKYYNLVWPQRYVYQLMINTEAGDGAVIETMLHQMEQLNAAGKASAETTR